MELFSKIEEVRIVPVVVFNNASETIPTLNAMKEAIGDKSFKTAFLGPNFETNPFFPQHKLCG